MRTRASIDSALAISMSCWSAIDSPRTMAPVSIRTPRPSKMRAAARRISRQSMDPRRRARGHEDVLGTAQVGEEARLLVDDGDAQRSGVCRTVERDLLSVEPDRA